MANYTMTMKHLFNALDSANRQPQSDARTLRIDTIKETMAELAGSGLMTPADTAYLRDNNGEGKAGNRTPTEEYANKLWGDLGFFEREKPTLIELANKAEGLPLGNWLDETLYTDKFNKRRDAYNAERPESRRNANLMGAGAFGAGTAVLSGASALAGQGSFLPKLSGILPNGSAIANLLRATGVGLGVGATEGAIDGYGDQEGAGRASNSYRQAKLGGIFGGFTGAGVSGLSTIAQGLSVAKNKPRLTRAGRRAGLEPEPARIVAPTLTGRDYKQNILPQMQDAGKYATLADATPESGALLSASLQDTSPAVAALRGDLTTRGQRAEDDFMGGLKAHVGYDPRNTQTDTKGFRLASAFDERSDFNHAYSQYVDYDSEAGQAIKSVLENRFGKEKIKKFKKYARDEGGFHSANPLLRLDGELTVAGLHKLYQTSKKSENSTDFAVSTDARQELDEAVALAIPEYAQAKRTTRERTEKQKGFELAGVLAKPQTTANHANTLLHNRDLSEDAAQIARESIPEHFTRKDIFDTDVEALNSPPRKIASLLNTEKIPDGEPKIDFGQGFLDRRLAANFERARGADAARISADPSLQKQSINQGTKPTIGDTSGHGITTFLMQNAGRIANFGAPTKQGKLVINNEVIARYLSTHIDGKSAEAKIKALTKLENLITKADAGNRRAQQGVATILFPAQTLSLEAAE